MLMGGLTLDNFLGLSSGLWGAVATILAGGLAVIASWWFARGAERERRRSVARYALASLEVLRTRLEASIKRFGSIPIQEGTMIHAIGTGDAPGFDQLRKDIGLLGLNYARIFLWIDSQLSEMRERTFFDGDMALPPVREMLKDVESLIKLCQKLVPDYKNPKES
jgi:hypothetical protein